ncbi:hypothetical protein scyTo_0006825 [Scyliorhinus torazame]|uniref:CCHC-type domain-containing protein n=1 Tax=Scyliorhinus torazame TaxID=75743 RepID=A0A401NH03_SCYTO|nr:hypothetical protein [Scyliorhinus torazame]
MSIMSILFTGEERGMIKRAVMCKWENSHPPGLNGPPAEEKYPNQDPHWDHQTGGHRDQMKDLRTIIIEGIREAVPKAHNLNKAFKIRQEGTETPSAFLERFRESVRKYSGLDPNDPIGQGLLKIHFVTKSWPDIHRKLHKIEDWNEKSLDELLREAQKVFVRREDVKEKQKTKMMVATVNEVVSKQGQAGIEEPRRGYQDAGFRGRGRGRGSQVRRGGYKNSQQAGCFNCGRRGHFIRDCPDRAQEDRTANDMNYTDTE